MTMRDNDGRRPVVRNDGFSWGLPAAIVAGILVVGGLFYMKSGGTQTTASSERPATTQFGPAGSQAPVNTPNTTPAPKQ
jgi:hypothetical protein